MANDFAEVKEVRHAGCPTKGHNSSAPDVDAASGLLIFHSAPNFQTYAEQRLADWKLHNMNGLDKHNQRTPDGSHATPQPCMFLYQGTVFDVSEFVPNHPGGAEVMERYNGKDITTVFHDEYNFHNHSGSALSMMLQYRIGYVKEPLSSVDESVSYAVEELTAYPKITSDAIVYKEFTIYRNRGMIWQAMHLPLAQYLHFIDTPIYVMPCQLFDYAFFEPFSKTKFWIVPVLWLPLSLFWFLRGVLRDYSQLNAAWGSSLDRYLYYPNANLIFHNYPAPVTSAMAASYVHATTAAGIAQEQLRHAQNISRFHWWLPVFFFCFGLVLWTFMEYVVHRFVFHFERLMATAVMDCPASKWLHLILHGIHHVIPMDPDRLVFPPALFVVISTIIYHVYGLFFNGSCLDIIASGVVFGYVCYDEIHFLIHHAEPTDPYFKDLKKYHHAHHYVDSYKGYGISNKFWDWVFGTMCEKR